MLVERERAGYQPSHNLRLPDDSPAWMGLGLPLPRAAPRSGGVPEAEQTAVGKAVVEPLQTRDQPTSHSQTRFFVPSLAKKLLKLN